MPEPLTLTPHMGDRVRDAYWESRNQMLADWRAMPLWFKLSTAAIGAIVMAAALI